MRKEMFALVAATFILGVGTATFLPGDAFAAKHEKKVSACDKIKDKKKMEKCMKDEAEAMKKKKK
ncbi:MAG: hypothetical protein O3A85_10040 [Proteobacteria bacterium]|nr:hypothetical protein [Pseudomonadota bacterium]